MRVVLDVNVWTSAKANVIVTGDLDLLIFSEFQGIPILKPIDFISRYFPAR
ncbi:MAG: hypothetical protein F6K18_11495 [Okeania sp. SIO2C2]|uniref:hypothetical protein n=1 Tax=Okeania sp. SIO2C2 TaxID=2607787 RepID=UPI0013B91B21|nr:hypothetical protein [Okeania sp. SIO2C2]NEP87397.1 hypothetical protein [Okeania sp. SIO2C2]